MKNESLLNIKNNKKDLLKLNSKKKNKFYFLFLILVILIFLSFSIKQLSSQENVPPEKIVSAYGPKIEKEYYTISRSKVDRVLTKGSVFRDFIEISNYRKQRMEVSFSVSDSLSDYLDFENTGIIVSPGNTTRASFLIKGKSVGNHSGKIYLKGDIQQEIPVNLTIFEEDYNPPVLIDAVLLKKTFILDKKLEFKLNVNKLKHEKIKNASFSYYLIDSQNNTYFLGSEIKEITNSFQVVKSFDFPDGITVGPYNLEVVLEYNNRILINKSLFLLRRSFFKIMIFGVIPMWFLLIFLAFVFSGILGYYLIKRNIQKKKKYQMKLDTNSIPKKNPDFFYLGKIAETKIPAYLDPLRLTTHTIVAGATGGGKSISAQVIIEEALMHNVAVLVFDPTAQWSGMLRKCVDKKMLSYYPKFGLKETDARGFKGNVRQVVDARELIDIRKYVTPGQIQIFSLNKLPPSKIDMFVANVIRQVFRSDPKEEPNLKILLVFDEVHRLLSKFGGSGEGFLQVERACREFRKWGIGVMLVSQVLADFVGEIKANISTEVQMRTRDEGDLERIKTKYGEDFLQSLVKASVGVGMFVNPAYNHARPYFINFRPILHNTRRLSDEELEKYNQYNNIVDDLEFQINKLEKDHKIDTFDLKMELKLVKDKIMAGSFSVVEIYLEGLRPRVQKEWEKLGLKPPKREIELVSEEDIKKSIEEAKKQRAKIEAEEVKKEKNKPQEKEKKIDIQKKILRSLTFDNGIMVSSIEELVGVMDNLDEEIFKLHVNENRNDIAKWISENISPEEGNRLKGLLDKSSMKKGLMLIGKNKPVKKSIKKDAKKSDEKIPVNDDKKPQKVGVVKNKEVEQKPEKNNPKENGENKE